MSLILSTAVASIAAETAEHSADPAVPIIAAAIAFGVFLLLGIVTWSYRDVANRTTRGRGAGHTDGHAGH